MIAMKFDSKQFKKDMDNIINYSIGFVDGVSSGKNAFLNSIGPEIVELASQYIDSNANVSPATLHHVYEWYQTGSPDARLFDIDYTVSNLGLSFISKFKQSNTIKNGSREPFRDKARIMENGISVTIKPKNVDVLRFEINGDVVYTKRPVVVDNPGGATQDGFAKAFDAFFGRYFTQSFLRSSGLSDYFDNPIVYKINLQKGKRMGRSQGLSTGYRWVANAAVGAR